MDEQLIHRGGGESENAHPAPIPVDIAALGVNQLVSYYLTLSFCYYQMGESVVSDAQFDLLSERIYKSWDKITHRHRDLIDREALRTSGYYLTYNARIEQAAYWLIKQHRTTEPQNHTTTMGGTTSRNKGQRGEREVCALLQSAAEPVYGHFDYEAPEFKRNLNQTQNGGFDIVGVDWLALEVKFQESAFQEAWWAQTLQQATNGEEPVLFYRKGRQPWRVVMLVNVPPLPDKVAVHMKVEEWLVWFQYKIAEELKKESETPY